MAGQMVDPRSLEWVALQARRRLEEQPWWRRKANTVTVLLGSLATLLLFLAGEFSGTEYGEWIGVAAGWVGTVYGVFRTRNGVTEREVVELEVAAGRAGVLPAVVVSGGESGAY